MLSCRMLMMGKWSDDSVEDTVVISDEDVCCSVVFGTLVGVFSVMWSELPMTSAICGHQCTSAIKWSVCLHLR